MQGLPNISLGASFVGKSHLEAGSCHAAALVPFSELLQLCSGAESQANWFLGLQAFGILQRSGYL